MDRTGYIPSYGQFMLDNMAKKTGMEKYESAKTPFVLLCGMGDNMVSIADPDVVRDLMTVKNNMIDKNG